jgi:hypothetical protein
MIARFREILASAFNYLNALEREKLKQSDVNLLRGKLKESKIVPKSLVDKQVCDPQNNRKKLNYLFCKQTVH